MPWKQQNKHHLEQNAKEEVDFVDCFEEIRNNSRSFVCNSSLWKKNENENDPSSRKSEKQQRQQSNDQRQTLAEYEYEPYTIRNNNDNNNTLAI
mmetsp:Transcript_31414/g.46622  ORF Transcript_31414/g.46622 Transcript_31414/m.46622 type:complete len:94 (+) Transcript_31414:695-976(+)